ncbi:MAG: hypothetical protein K6D61_01165 [Prevotella sp.]|nr:hypothetical protein [Prevotella sp.]
MKKTVYYRNVLFLFLFMLPLLATTCEQENDEFFQMDQSGKPILKAITTISDSVFNDQIVGKGWHCTKTQLFNEMGRLDEFRWTADGSGPIDLYFSKDSLWQFIYEKDRNLLVADKYVYNPRENLVESSIANYMQIISISNWQLRTIERLGDFSVYVLNYYEPMSDYELNAHWLGFKPEEE